MRLCEIADPRDPVPGEHRQAIVDNIEEEYRLPNLIHAVPPDQIHHLARMVGEMGLPKITIYRGVPAHVTEIRPGDWVALTRGYAARHGGGTVIEMRVPADHVAWAGTDKNEYYYVPR